MSPPANRIFLSYRRDDAAGYAGRLEEALERRLGRGSVFRDVLDLTPGEDFVQVLHSRLAEAAAVLVLIGPRWAGEGPPGQRRIDQAHDFVRLEVGLALERGVKLVPVLLPGGRMPAEAELPAPLQALAHRQALSLGDMHWEADVDCLAAALGLARRRARWPWAAGVLAALALAAGWAGLRGPQGAPGGAPPAAVFSAAWPSVWQAEVLYAWGDRYTERFEFKRHAGQLVGTASFLGHPLPAEALQEQGPHVRFITHSRQSMGGETRDVTHHYSAELGGAPPVQTLSLRMHTTGGFETNPPLEFEARRLAAGPASSPAGEDPGPRSPAAETTVR